MTPWKNGGDPEPMWPRGETIEGALQAKYLSYSKFDLLRYLSEI